MKKVVSESLTEKFTDYRNAVIFISGQLGNGFDAFTAAIIIAGLYGVTKEKAIEDITDTRSWLIK